MSRGHQLFLIAILFCSFYAAATDRVSSGSGNWATAATWSPSGVPASGDNITVLSGHTIAINSNAGTCNNLTVNGTLGCNNGRILDAGGNLVINNGGVINGGTGKLNITGTFSVPAGSSAYIGSVTLEVAGVSTLDGKITFTSTSGTKSFSHVTVNSGGEWTSVVDEAISINGDVTANSIFNCDSGAYNISGNFFANAATTTFEGTIGGTLSVANTATFNVSSGNCSVSGATTISGVINITTTAGSKNFHDITINTGSVWNSSVAENVTVTGNVVTNGAWNCFSGTYSVSGNFSVNAGVSYFEGSIEGDLAIAAGGTFDSPTGILKVVGSTSVSGILKISTTTSSKSFADVTVNNGGIWDCSVAESLTISGNITNNGTFISHTGTYTFSGSGKVFSGTLSIARVAVTGTYSNNAVLTVETALTGSGTLTQGANSVLNIGGTSSITNLTATVVPNTVNYAGSVNQTIKVTPYYNLDVNSTGGTVTFGAITVNNNFTVTTGTVSIGGVTMSVLGATSISGTLRIASATGTKTFNDLTINTGGTWNSAVAEAFTINGNVSNSGTFTANTGVYTLAGVSKTISGTLAVPTFSVTGSYTNNALLTSATALAGPGTFSQGSTGTLNLGTTAANFSVTTFNASAQGNTVNYNRASAQSVRVPSDGSYHHLTLAGSGNKTLLGLTDVNGDITVSSILVANNFNITLGGNWLNTGTFIPGANTVTFDGGGQSLAKSGGETFNHLEFSGSGTKTLGSAIITNGNLTIHSALDISLSNFAVNVKGNWVNNGAFTQRNGTVTLSGGAAQTIGGTATTSFNNLVQNNSAGVSLAHAQNLIDSLTISSGTFTATGYDFTLVSDANNTARIAAIPSGANFAGKIIMQRYTGTGPTDWRLLSSPVSGATIADWADDFATSGFPGSTDPGNAFVSILSYDETALGITDNGYVPATDITNSISAGGKGFYVYVGPNPVTYEVNGPPNTFTVTPSLTFTSSGPGFEGDDGWNLVANPYPSAINWDNPNLTKTNLDNAVYIYNSSTGSFASYVAGAGTNGGSQYIASQQAFWVKANAPGPAITLVEKVKAGYTPSFLKSAPVQNISHCPMAFNDFPIPRNANTRPNSIKLTAKGKGLEDETLIYFTHGATRNFDGQFDAWKLPGDNSLIPDISSVINDSADLSINGYPALTSDVIIPIRMRVKTTGNYSIRRDSVLMLPASSCVILEDLATKNFTDLRTSISYSFTISDTTSAPRFLLHIYAPVTKSAVKARCINDRSGIAVAKGPGAGPWNYTWRDSQGAILKMTSNSMQADSLLYLLAGVYAVEVSGSVCGIVSDTIEIRSSSAMVINYAISNVSCNGLNDGSAVIDVHGGNVPYLYAWNTGATTSALHAIPAGNYSVVVTDARACTLAQVFSVSQPPVLAAGFVASTDTVDLSVDNSVVFTDMSAGTLFCQWDFGDTTLPDTSRNPLHYYSNSGIYAVTQMVSNGTCRDTSYAHIVVVDSLNTTGIQDPEAGSSVNVVYENGQVFLLFSLNRETRVNITVYNALGENIFSQNNLLVKKEKIKLNFSSASMGVYIAVSEMNDKVISRKIVIPLR